MYMIFSLIMFFFGIFYTKDFTTCWPMIFSVLFGLVDVLSDLARVKKVNLELPKKSPGEFSRHEF